jgi:hypothetical protein
MLEQPGRDPRSPPVGRRAHGLDLGVAVIQPLDRTAADQRIAVQDGPERDLGPAERVEIEGMLAL